MENQLLIQSDKLIKLIKKREFDKIKLFFFENKLSIKNDDLNNNIIINEDHIPISAKNLNFLDIRNDENIKKEYNICEKLDKKGWNALHYVSYYGYSEILEYMLNNLLISIDPNIF